MMGCTSGMMDLDPKTRAQMLEIQGRAMKEIGELLEKRGRAMEDEE